MNKIIFATSNAGKMKEIREILKDLNVEILSMKEAGIDVDIVEDGKTFEENALIKARAIRDLTGCLVLADDSGLEVDALNKEPGIYSARYMGEDTSYNLKNANIIERLSREPSRDRLPMHRPERMVLAMIRFFMCRSMTVRQPNWHRSRKMRSVTGERH